MKMWTCKAKYIEQSTSFCVPTLAEKDLPQYIQGSNPPNPSVGKSPHQSGTENGVSLKPILIPFYQGKIHHILSCRCQTLNNLNTFNGCLKIQ